MPECQVKFELCAALIISSFDKEIFKKYFKQMIEIQFQLQKTEIAVLVNCPLKSLTFVLLFVTVTLNAKHTELENNEVNAITSNFFKVAHDSGKCQFLC